MELIRRIYPFVLPFYSPVVYSLTQWVGYIATSTLTSTAEEHLIGAIKSLSALIFLTLLWISFTLLEAADSRPNEKEKEFDVIFGKTWVELVLNTMCLGAWVCELIHSL
jgi:hypothetical protein